MEDFYMPDRSLKVGLIGCGNVAFGHARVINELENTIVAGIVDPTLERRQKMQGFLHLPDSICYSDYRDLLAQEIDYVVIATPQHVRPQIVVDCAKAGVHVLSEKPISTIPYEAQAMITAMRSSNLHFGMMHNYLFYPEYELARKLIDQGAIGKVRHVTLNFLGVPDNPGAAEYRPAWRHDPVAAGGGILMDMIHAVYLAEFLLGGKIQDVNAVVDNLDHIGDQVEDFTIVNYHIDSSYATINMWWGNGPGGVEISGTEGRILVFYENYGTGPFTEMESFTLVNANGKSTFDPRTAQSEDPFVQVHKNFQTAIRTGCDPVAPGEAGLQALEATLAAYASGATGHVINLPLKTDDPIYRKGVAGIQDLDVLREGRLFQKGIFGLH
jgi:predicted dehydrogenase